jgi:hypothetical protein
LDPAWSGSRRRAIMPSLWSAGFRRRWASPARTSGRRAPPARGSRAGRIFFGQARAGRMFDRCRLIDLIHAPGKPVW